MASLAATERECEGTEQQLRRLRAELQAAEEQGRRARLKLDTLERELSRLDSGHDD